MRILAPIDRGKFGGVPQFVEIRSSMIRIMFGFRFELCSDLGLNYARRFESRIMFGKFDNTIY